MADNKLEEIIDISNCEVYLENNLVFSIKNEKYSLISKEFSISQYELNKVNYIYTYEENND